MDEAEFWTWFKEHHSDVAQAMRSDDLATIQQTLANVNERLQRVAPGVSFLYGHQNGINEFVATANGMRDRMHAVISLVESAPQLDGWDFTAFRPPSDVQSQIKMGGLTLGVADVKFLAFDLGNDGLGITLYPDGMTEDERDLYQHIAVILMDHVVGEYDAMTLIDSLAVDLPSEIPSDTEARPLSELRQFLHDVRDVE